MIPTQVFSKNKVDILFQLNRDIEAYECVYRMHREFAELEYFREAMQTPGYKTMGSR
jgi:hypothetical protein